MTAAIPFPDIPNKGAEGVSYFTPAQDPVSGSSSDPQADGTSVAKLFKSLQIRDIEFQNRIFVCRYPRPDGLVFLNFLQNGHHD